MSNKNIKSKKGFTIIEVVLVLAIAGLIFLMVFIALPQLQRAQRDTQRRNDLARVSTAITQYQTNNGGKLPGAGTGANLITNYLGGTDFVDPDGSSYTIAISKWEDGDGATNDLSTSHEISVYTQAKCKGEEVEGGDNPREYAVVYKLEGSGVYCQDNQ